MSEHCTDFDSSDWKGQRAMREPRETFALHLVSPDHNAHCHTRYQWQMRHYVTGRPMHPDLKRARDLKQYGADAVSAWEMADPSMYQDTGFFGLAKEICG